MAESFTDLDIPDHTILAELGRGGMARVYLARDEHLKRLVALKVMDATLQVADASFVKRFVREAQTAASLSHPNIVPVHQFGETDDGRHWLTMTYLEGGSLKDRLKQGRVNPEEAIGITRQVASALMPAHARNIIHRDIKPDNVLFQGEAACLTDFGIAKLMDATTQLTEAGNPGTIKYMSPEQVEGRGLDQRSDIYSLGVMLYEMLTLKAPTQGDTMASMLYHIANSPPEPLPAEQAGLQPLMDLMLVKEPAERIPSCDELVKVLAAIERNMMRGMDMDHITDGIDMPRSGAPLPEHDVDEQDATLPDTPQAGTSRVGPQAPDSPAAPRTPAPLPPATTEQTANTHPAPQSETSEVGAGLGTVGLAADASSSVDPTATKDAHGQAGQTDEAERGVRSPSSWRWIVSVLALVVLAGGFYLYATGLFDGNSDGWEVLREPAPPSSAQKKDELGEEVQVQQGAGILVVTTEPPGATVAVDGREMGVTPDTFESIAAGKRRVELTLAHHETKLLTAVPIAAGKITREDHRLSRSVGELNVLTRPMDATVLIDGEPQSGRTPMTVPRVSSGLRQVTVRKPGFQDYRESVMVMRNQIARLDVALERGMTGTLQLDLRPSDAQVVLPEIGPSYQAGMSLPLGPLRVRVSARGFETFEEVVIIKAGSNSRMITLSRSGPEVGSIFRDMLRIDAAGPEMIVVPAGSFRRGSNDGDSDEKPVRTVTLAEPFAVGVYEVTFAEYDAFAAATGAARPDDRSWWRRSRPVINVSWGDAQRYVRWLSEQTGERYRLLTEAEWEYVARAGSSTRYNWGDNIGNNLANCDGCSSQWDKSKTAPVGQFRANSFGLYDVHGNVWEWVEDCYTGTYSGVPTDGSAMTSRICERRVLRGGSWYVNPAVLRSANRLWSTPSARNFHIGFRVARTL